MQIAISVVVCGLSLGLPALGQEFNGSWRLASERPESGTLPERPAEMLEILQKPNLVRCAARRGAAKPLVFSFTIDGKETKTRDGDRTLSVESKWEGSALLVNTIVNGISSYTQMDRWRVSRDGTQLTIRREVVRLRGGAESVLIYRKQ